MNGCDQMLELGLQAHRAGRLQQAECIYRQALQINPACAETLHLLGLLLHNVGQSFQAIEMLGQAITLNPANALYHSSLALVYRESGWLEEAVLSYRRALRLDPADADSYYNLGVVLRRLNRLTEAAVNFSQAIRLSPDFAAAHYNLGVVQRKLNQAADAMACFRRAVRLRPDYLEARYNLAVTLARQEQIDEAAAQYQMVLRQCPEKTLWRLEMDTLFPAIPASVTEIEAWRTRLEVALNRYAPGRINLEPLLADIPTCNALQVFNLHYHGRNNLPLLKRYAGLFSVPDSLAEPPKTRATPPFKIGFLVTASHEGIFATAVAGLINQLNGAEFQPIIICPPQSVGRIRPHLTNPAVTFLPLPANFEQAVRRIKEAGFNLIYFWEVGTDSVNYFLPFFRLAPVQVTSWGSVGSTGIPQMDYFISSRLLEAPDASHRYSEQVVLLDDLLTYFYRPPRPQPFKSRAAFGLPEQAHLYFCPQTLRKFHPDFDALLADILRRDRQGVLLLVRGRNPIWTVRLRARWQHTMPDVLGRVRFMPQQNYADYLNLLALSDVLLDTLYFGGGATTYDALAAGTPLVTLPTSLLMGRVAAGCYRHMELSGGVADSAADYVELALKFGTDRPAREQVRAEILARHDRLFENKAVVKNLEQFFKQAIQEATW